MIKSKYIKPIPKHILKLIKQADDNANKTLLGRTRFYAYLAIYNKELVKVTVAVKNYYKQWLYKQVAVHGIHSDICYIKDIVFYTICGYVVGWFEQGVGRYPKWFENPEWGWQEDRLFDPQAPIVNHELIDKLPEYKYSAHKLYDGVDILQYLRHYEKYPVTEYMLKLGLNSFVLSKQILEKATKDKSFRKWLANNREELKSRYYYVLTIISAYNKKLDLRYLQAYTNAKKNIKDYKRKAFVEEKFGNLENFYHYIAKHDTTISTYDDYIDACEYLKLNIQEEKHCMPHDFNKWHDIRTDERDTQQALKDAKERKKFYAKFALVAEKYTELQHDKQPNYICIIAKTPYELIVEGKKLHHCVGGLNYCQKFNREETLIFFIRCKETPDIPLATLEYSPTKHSIIQCHANKNLAPSLDVMTYVKDIWLPYANRQIKQIVA